MPDAGIIFEDDRLIIANKRAGMPAVPDPSGNPDLLSALSALRQMTLYPIHRLDRPVSGLIAFAKNQQAAHFFAQAFRDKKVKKTYLAFVEKNQKIPHSATLEHSLARDGRLNKSFISPQGKRSVLDYEILMTLDHYYLLQIHLHTGRHHQIRAQMAAIGCPVKGDNKYGARRGNRDRSIDLHAWKLHLPPFPHWTAPLPAGTLWEKAREQIS